MPDYTPAIYRRFSTPLSLNLGPTADLVDSTNKLVQTVKTNTDGVPDLKKDVTDARAAAEAAGKAAVEGRQEILAELVQVKAHTVDQLAKTTTAIVGGVQSQLDKASAEIVKQVLAGAALPQPFSVGERSVHLVRLLAQVTTLALDKSPGEPFQPPKKLDWKENITIDSLRDIAAAAIDDAGLKDHALGKRLLEAFRRFDGVDLPSRSVRFVEVHALMREVALAL